MLLGTRLEYCVSDLLLKKINVNDVYAIVGDTRINFHNTEDATHWWNRQLDPMTSHLSQGRNSLHLYDFEEVYQYILTLIDSGKLVLRDKALPSHAFDAMISDLKNHWYQINLREVDMEPAVKLAWEHYVLLSGLCK
jgi:hypothetical protein